MFSVVLVIVFKIAKYHCEDFKDEQLYSSPFTFVTLFVNYITIRFLKYFK
jgi:hypothetical protein